MTTATKKPAAPKTEKKEPASKPEAKAAAAAAPKAEAKKASASAGSVKITQLVGTIARKWDQEATLKGLGLGKRHRSRVLKDTPEVRGMIYKVRHLVKVEAIS